MYWRLGTPNAYYVAMTATTKRGENMNGPILRIGQYGTHIIDYPTGRYGFVGTVPCDLGSKTYATYQEAVNGFLSWLESEPIEYQQKLVGDLRNDIFEQFTRRK